MRDPVAVDAYHPSRYVRPDSHIPRWSPPTTAPEPDRSLGARLRESLAKHADLPAIEGRHAVYTYRDLERQSALLARALADAGVRAGDIVPLLLRRSPALIIAQVALVRLGAAYAPIDLTSPPERQRIMLQQLAATVILTDGSVAVPELSGTLQINVHDAGMTSLSDDVPWHAGEPQTLAYVMFTSGTTGVPKGVLIPQSGIVRLVCDADFAEMRVGARWGFLSSPAFDASTLEVWAPLLNGGCCVVQEEVMPSLDELGEFVSSNRITDAFLTTALFNALVDDQRRAFARVRQLLTGGERVSARHYRLLIETFPALRLISCYGPTENTTFTTCHTVTLADTTNPAGIPLGQPITGTTIRIGVEPAEAAEGELLAAGDGVAIGYLGDPALTARKFIELGEQRWYCTGDLVRRRADGALDFCGRTDRQVKLQGHRIELDGVEQLLGAVPGVGQCALVVHGDTAETRYLAAYYTGFDAAPPPISEVAGALARTLPPSALPKVFHPMARLPLTATGKVDYAALSALAVSHAAQGPTQPWLSDTERALAAIWKKSFPSATIDCDTSFSAIGGTSLLALQVSAQVRRELGRDLTPIDVLRTPRLRDQARSIDAAPPFAADEANDAPAEDQLLLTQVQRGMLAGSQLDGSGCAYLVHVALHLERPPRERRLKRAFEKLAERHPSLRIRVRSDTSSRLAEIAPRLGAHWWQRREELAAVPDNLGWPAALLEVVNRPMDLRRDGVLRVDFWPVADGTALLVWTVHHIAVDEASVDRCLAELDALLNGEKLQPVYGGPFAFASIEKEWTDHGAAGQWSRTLVGALAGVEPPLPRAPRPGNEVAISLPADLWPTLQQSCARWGITPVAPLLVAYGQALQEVFGEAHRFVSTAFSRRAEPDLLEAAGCFIELAFVEAGVRAGENSDAALARVRDALVALQRPAFLPHAAIGELIGQRDPAVARHLNGFGFTWRVDPQRTVPLGSGSARLLRVQQQGARFGLTLHAWQEAGELRSSIEAVDAAFDNARVEQVSAAFVRRLAALSDVGALERPVPDELLAGAPRAEVVGALRDAWSRWLGVPAEGITDDTDFLACGGNSLTAMRMLAQLRREHGIAIDVGGFLARSTFGVLCQSAGARSQRSPSCCVVVGKADAPRIVLIIGHRVGSFVLATEIQRVRGPDAAVIVADLDALRLRAPMSQPLGFLRERLTQIVTEIGPHRVEALVGFSMGGSFALLLAQRFLGKQVPPVWLLDTYAPLGSIRTGLHRTIRPVARRLLRSGRIAALLGTHVRASDPRRLPAAASPLARLWLSRSNKLALEASAALDARVRLVKARQTVGDVVGSLWRRSSNGFDPRRYASWQVHEFNARHEDLQRLFASDIAELIATELRDPVGKGPCECG